MCVSLVKIRRRCGSKPPKTVDRSNDVILGLKQNIKINKRNDEELLIFKKTYYQ